MGVHLGVKGKSGAKVVGYAPGVYDLFHVGHLNVLRQAKHHCDHLIAGVLSDEMCLLAKGFEPFVPMQERLEIVSHVDVVDSVHAEVNPDKVETWQQVRFNRIFKGDDWLGTAKGDKLERDLAPFCVDVVYFPYTAHTSSSQLRRALVALSRDASVGINLSSY